MSYSESISAKQPEDKQSLFLTLRGETPAWSRACSADGEWSVEGVGAGHSDQSQSRISLLLT